MLLTWQTIFDINVTAERVYKRGNFKMEAKKHLIFLGGEAGVGKSISAKKIRDRLNNCIVIDKDESTSILAEALLESYGQHKGDRESEIYLSKVKPLEYKQLVDIIWGGISNTSMIVTAPYFDLFIDDEWLDAMKDIGDFHKAKVSFIFMTRCPSEIQSGLVARGEYRDKWKIYNYSRYRKNTDVAINKVLKNKEITHFHFSDIIDVDLMVNHIETSC